MTIKINDTHRIISSECGGFELQKLDGKGDKIRLSKAGNPLYKFIAYMPTLDKIMMVAIMECDSVLDTALTDTAQIIAAINAAKAECIEAVKGMKGEGEA
jgi:hypothetical protein